jgi:hypothetical protein
MRIRGFGGLRIRFHRDYCTTLVGLRSS